MEHPGFFERAGPFSLGAIAEAAGASPAGQVDLDASIKDVRPLDAAGQSDLRATASAVEPSTLRASAPIPTEPTQTIAA